MRTSNLLIPVALSLISLGVAGQTPRPVPTLTTDDVALPARPAAPQVNPATPQKGDEKKDQPKAPADGGAAGEKDWNTQVKQAQEKVADLDRRADQAELEITQMRNFLHSAQERAPETNQQVLNRIESLSSMIRQLRATSVSAQSDLSKLISDGSAQGFKIAEPSLTTAGGTPDLGAIQSVSEQARLEIKDAEARLDILQVRLNGVQAGIYKSGNADSFALGKLKQERERITDEIEKNRSRISELNAKLHDLQQRAQAQRPEGK